LSIFKKLAGQTATYGLSSILGRLLNYLLVPLYTRVFDTDEYGIVTQLYAYVAFLNIVYTYGLETAFFRFFQSEKGNSKVYSTGLLSIIASSVFFTLAIILFSDPVASTVLPGNESGSFYIILFAGIIASDAITALPFAKLRQENNAKRFAFLRLFNIAVNIGLNLFFLVLCPFLVKSYPDSGIGNYYNAGFGIGYVFISNLIASLITLLLMYPEIFKNTFQFDNKLWKQMMVYSFPLMIGGFAGMINETFDRILIPILLKDQTDAMTQLGIYGACYKLSIIMTLFIQTFRYAAEPFFFNNAGKENPQQIYVQVMKYFVIVCTFIFLAVMLYIDIVSYLIGPDFRSGIGVVPVLLLANLCLGVYFNLSIWYKLTSNTRWGAWISIFGAAITLVFNFLLIPVMGFYGAAWATLICYASMMLLSYFIGRKYYPVPYDILSFFYYLALALSMWGLSVFVTDFFELKGYLKVGVNTLILILFSIIFWLSERRKINYLRGLNNF
jgi:O-antigen/teichoic acid export membrane protein